MRKDYNLAKRRWVIIAFLLVIAAIFAVRLWDLQLHDSKYKESADSNAFLKKTIYPSRGLMYDRNGELVVFNQRRSCEEGIVPRSSSIQTVARSSKRTRPYSQRV